MSETVRIPLRNKRGAIVAYALVDAVDAPALLQHRWHRTTTGYAARFDLRRKRSCQMHKDILGPYDGECDHVSRDTLDNRRSNLRIVTHAQNMQNRPAQRNSRSGIRGVHQKDGRWQAQARLAGRKIHLGYFSTPSEADNAARAFRARNMPFSQDALSEGTI